jgi:hypothetical protein
MHRIWPIGLTVFFVLFVAGMVAFVAWSAGHREDLVAPDYYEQEIRYQERIEASARAGAAGLRPAIAYDAAMGRLKLSFGDPAALQSATGTVTLYRPSDAAMDRVFAFEPDAEGAQSIPVALASGLWRVKTEWHKDGQAFYAEEAIRLP